MYWRSQHLAVVHNKPSPERAELPARIQCGYCDGPSVGPSLAGATRRAQACVPSSRPAISHPHTHTSTHKHTQTDTTNPPPERWSYLGNILRTSFGRSHLLEYVPVALKFFSEKGTVTQPNEITQRYILVPIVYIKSEKDVGQTNRIVVPPS